MKIRNLFNILSNANTDDAMQLRIRCEMNRSLR